MKKIFFFLILALLTSTVAFSAPLHAPDNDKSGIPMSEEVVLKYCKWYISTPPSADPAEEEVRGAIAAYIVTYISETEKFSIQLGGAVSKILGLNATHSNTDLLAVYLAGETIYCLEHDLKESDATSFAHAMVDVMNFYSMLPDHNVKSLDKYLNMDNAQRLKKFEKFYNSNHKKE